MKNTIFPFFILLLFFSCNSDIQNDPINKGEAISDKTVVEKSYTGKPLNRFDQAILNMEKEDSTRITVDNEVLFIGSSSIRMWKTLRQDFDPIPVINRGFGGSTLPEVIHYADRIIFPYQPKLIVLYCGENDIADGANPQQVFESYKKLDELLQSKLPKTTLVYLAMKPSVARWNLWEKYQKGDKMIRENMKGKSSRVFIDCSPSMLNENGEPDAGIFVEDMLHMNKKGYEGWKKIVRPQVEKLYNEITQTSINVSDTQ